MLNGFEEYSRKNVAELDAFLSRQADSEDTYLTSTHYLLLTGRHGLWVAREEQSYWVVCRHPNKPNTILILPPTQNLNLTFLSQICAELKKQCHEIIIGRIQYAHKHEFAAYDCFLEHEERVLDWKYPVIIYDNSAVSKFSGSEFSQLRQKINKIDSNKIENVRVNADNHKQHRQDANSLIDQWAKAVAQKKNFTIENLVQPNLFAYDMSTFGLDNFVVDFIFYDGMPMAIQTAEFVRRGDVANCISLSGSRSPAGGSEYTYYLTAKNHLNNGFKLTSINGAETATLHEFRKKLNPVRNIKLTSYSYDAI